jgi:hypothetical protein
MDGVHEPHSLVGAERKASVALDEGLPPFRVELASDRLGLDGFEPKPMQHRDQPRAALISGAEFLLDIRADLARRTRQGRGDPALQLRFLVFRQARAGAAALKPRQPLKPVLQEQPMPAPDRFVQRRAHSSNRRREGPTRSRAAKRCAADPSRANAINAAGLPQKGGPLEPWTN